MRCATTLALRTCSAVLALTRHADPNSSRLPLKVSGAGRPLLQHTVHPDCERIHHAESCSTVRFVGYSEVGPPRQTSSEKDLARKTNAENPYSVLATCQGTLLCSSKPSVTHRFFRRGSFFRNKSSAQRLYAAAWAWGGLPCGLSRELRSTCLRQWHRHG